MRWRSRCSSTGSRAARTKTGSAALLRAIEARALERGAFRTTLLSTETAHRFYLARGYKDAGLPQRKFGTTSSYPMAKMLGPTGS
ncbi:MAG: hypothetical protein WBE02_22270, partial [Bradyrhizobium sp.]